MPWVDDRVGVAEGTDVGVGPPGDGDTAGVPAGVPVAVGAMVPVCVGAGVGVPVATPTGLVGVGEPAGVGVGAMKVGVRPGVGVVDGGVGVNVGVGSTGSVGVDLFSHAAAKTAQRAAIARKWRTPGRRSGRGTWDTLRGRASWQRRGRRIR